MTTFLDGSTISLATPAHVAHVRTAFAAASSVAHLTDCPEASATLAAVQAWLEGGADWLAVQSATVALDGPLRASSIALWRAHDVLADPQRRPAIAALHFALAAVSAAGEQVIQKWTGEWARYADEHARAAVSA